MKYTLSLLFFYISFLSGTNAQMILSSDYQILHPYDFISYNRSQIEKQYNAVSEDNVDGTPYLTDEFIKATIFTTSKNKYVDVPVRYNIYRDQIEFKNDEEVVYYISMPEIIEKIDLNGFQLEYVPYFEDKKIKKGFFSTVEKGKASLYTKQHVVFKGAKEPAPYQEAKNAKYIKKPDEFFIKIDSKPAKKFSGKRDIENIFSSHTTELKNFIKHNKVKCNDTESILKLVKYYNTL